MIHPRATEIVREALTWVGTPYRRLGRSRSGLDCVGLPVVVGKALGLHNFDSRAYAASPHPFELFEGLTKAGFTRVRPAEAGDLPVLRVGRHPCHVGIFDRDESGRLWLIHAYEPAQSVIRELYTEARFGRQAIAFRFPWSE